MSRVPPEPKVLRPAPRYENTKPPFPEFEKTLLRRYLSTVLFLILLFA